MSAAPVTLLRYAGFIIWALAGLPLLVGLAERPALLSEARYWLWLACFVVFGATFAATGWRAGAVPAQRWQLVSLLIQTAAALAMIQLVCSGTEGALLVIVAAQLGWVLPLRQALAWVAAQALLMCVILSASWSSHVTLSLMSIYLGFQVLALFSCFLTAREAAARADLARANRELHRYLTSLVGGCIVIRVCLVEDQTLVRQGLQTLLAFADDHCHPHARKRRNPDPTGDHGTIAAESASPAM